MKRGFTIIELLVVVSITGLISSIVLGNLTQARQRAVQTAALQFERSVRGSIGDTMVASWDFDEGTGNIARDTSGSGLDGAVNGALYVSPGFNNTGFGLYFSGSSYVAGIGTPTGDNLALTVSAWVRPVVNTNTRNIFVSGNPSCRTIGMGITSTQVSISNNNQQQLLEDPGTGGGGGIQDQTFLNPKNFLAAAKGAPGAVLAQTNFTIPNNTWTNIITTFDPSGNVRTYINGKLAGVASNFASTNCGTDNRWSIGAVALGGSTSDYFEGTIDNVVLYESTFTAAEVGKLYAQNLAEFKLAQQ